MASTGKDQLQAALLIIAYHAGIQTACIRCLHACAFAQTTNIKGGHIAEKIKALLNLACTDLPSYH
jgi:hypothetical protein